ncbi:DUF4366 domain-containing protein [Faecalicoccus pleomorphus]|uniref:DUF4366 domain-containing protein n=1 Tax=Faecalicoccus pleomorphus TaxID=1323 RepID=UPI0019613071|nr:DUF4366 domain-containing protein [Faecalicoccus pleomorphus]MBM6764649.1 DUF4366 domain-containing protein [Faecalicoccus pleomorphus]
MKNKKIIRLFTAALAVVLCATAFAVPASAGGGDGEPYYTETAEPEVTEEPQEETTGGMEPEGQPLTPEGNATLVDDFYGDKQLITVTTKAGNYFYILIDRANEDAETAVHFLNQVDEADLMALMEDGEAQETPAVCTCTEKCQAGAVNTSCEVCAVNMAECAGAEPEPEPEPEPEEEKSGGMGALALVLVLVVLGGGGAFAYIKFIRPKQASKASADPDDYDFADEEEYINEDEPEEETEDTK